MINSEQIAKESNRYHHNVVALIRDHKETLESIGELKVDKTPSRNGFKHVYWLDNQQLLYLAGISKKDPLKKVLLYHYFDTVEKLEEVNMNRPEEMPKWYSFLNLKNIIGN